MNWITKGKEKVLKHFEQESKDRTGDIGEYALAEDDSGNLIVIIAGHTFMGSGSFTMGDGEFEIQNGLIRNIE